MPDKLSGCGCCGCPGETIYFYPAFQGQSLRQTDVVNFRGMAQETIEFRRLYGQEPLWTNAMFSGMPAYQISVKFPNNIVKMIDGFFTLGLPKPASYLFLYLMGFYILLISFRVKPALAVVGSLAFEWAHWVPRISQQRNLADITCW